jgi:glycosyltransferase involved in cell wall biosynthesis
MKSAGHTAVGRKQLGNQDTARPIRVMQIITRLSIGGTSYQAVALTERLQGPQFQSVLLVGSVGPSEGSMEALAAERNVHLIRVPGLGREISPRSDGVTLYHLVQEMRRFRPDIVHTHLSKAGAVGRLAARLTRVPTVVHTYHNCVFHSYFSRPKTELILRIDRMLARWTDRIVVVGKAQEREILSFGVGRPEQMVCVPYGLELEPFLSAERHQGELRRELGMESDSALVGIVARLVPIKAHDLFLQAARCVVPSRRRIHFLIIGDGELRQPLEQQALALGFEVVSHQPNQPPLRRTPCGKAAQAVVHFLGFRFDLVPIYADLDVVVLCSLSEGLPISVIEALAAARPVVATEVGAVRDLIMPGETGLLVRRGDASCLANAIRKQLEEPDAARSMALRGRESVYPHLSIDRFEQDLRRHYRELALRKGLAVRETSEGERKRAA